MCTNQEFHFIVMCFVYFNVWLIIRRGCCGSAVSFMLFSIQTLFQVLFKLFHPFSYGFFQWHTTNHRRSQGGQRGHTPQFLENIVVLCFERRFSKQNSFIRLNQTFCPPKKTFGLPQIFGLATPLLPTTVSKFHVSLTMVCFFGRFKARCNVTAVFCFVAAFAFVVMSSYYPRKKEGIIFRSSLNMRTNNCFNIFPIVKPSIYVGRRGQGPRPRLVFWKLQQKGCFFSFEWEKTNVTTFAPTKILEISPSGPT